MTQKDLLDKIWEIIDNSGYGYFYAKKDVHDIWHLIYSSGVEMSDIKKQELFVNSIKELEMVLWLNMYKCPSKKSLVSSIDKLGIISTLNSTF